ncbi:hypothetical protein HanRHA438_Chr09g0386081 [Helianthus annuus]|nr:hypothetical protein HanIR_Chr09g0403571 [Helianthus annuus]KAJ0541394.1 hypothetical protein HanHA89_Chr09g0327951 [Helianthus annuus]KAJ0706473.1 hypothetical protein HanLR1_Chr09g0307421 [Helianthus annuus]KAJ0887025.1 hypothetical protein HanRHA438_Chr09g0386081 [Helianthus annuus]
MVTTWWIRRWYFLYISVDTMLPNFRKTWDEKFSVLQTMFRPNMQTLTTHKRIARRAISDYPRRDLILNTSLSSIRYLCYSYTHNRLLDQSFTLIPRLFSVVSDSKASILNNPLRLAKNPFESSS